VLEKVSQSFKSAGQTESSGFAKFVTNFKLQLCFFDFGGTVAAGQPELVRISSFVGGFRMRPNQAAFPSSARRGMFTLIQWLGTFSLDAAPINSSNPARRMRHSATI